MTKKEVIKSKNIIGLWCYNTIGYGIVVYHIDYNFNDYVYYCVHYGEKINYKKAKIYYNCNGEDYFLCDGKRIKFSDILKV